MMMSITESRYSQLHTFGEVSKKDKAHALMALGNGFFLEEK